MARALGKMVVGNILASAAMRDPGGLALYCSSTDRRFTFNDLDERSNRLARALHSLGLRKGDVLALLVSNRAEIVELFFACARTGIVALPLNYRLAEPELVELARSLGAAALVYEERFGPVARRLRQEIPSVRHLVTIGNRVSDANPEYESFIRRHPAEPPEGVEIGEEDPFYFSLTSGTTGLPKAYLLSHYSNCVIGFAFQAMDLGRDDVVMTVFPMHGRVGFSWVIGSLLLGIPNVIANFDPGDALRLIAAERVTIVNLVPTMAAMMLPVQASEPGDLSSLRAIVFAGAILPPAIRERSAALLCPDIYEYYGMNEMGLLALSRPSDRLRQPNSVGKPIVFSEVAIIGDDGKRLGANRIGEILGRSPLTTTGYYDSPEKSADAFQGGWLHTGDLGYVDSDGYLFIVGRKKDMIVTGGQNVYAAEVEEVVLHFPGVADCAVIGLPDDVWGERVTAVVVPAPSADVDAAEVEAYCRMHLAGFKIPKEFIIENNALPRTSTGKVQKFLLVERYGGRRGEASPSFRLNPAVS